MLPEWLTKPEYNIFCTHKNKVPTHGTHVDDMSTYYSYKKAKSLLQPGEGLGVGLFGNLCGIDIDHCVEDNKISPTAQSILEYFDGAYAEYSYSGTGIHLLFFCKEQHKYQKYYTKMGEKQLKDKGITDIGGLELYQGKIDNRYLTLTGNVIPTQRRNNYTVSPKKLKDFLEKYFLRPEAPTPIHQEFESSDKEDLAWWKWVRHTKKPDRLFELASKTPTGFGGTESEDDLAFMSELAFWCNKNAHIMRAAFEHSFYYANKDEAHKKKWARKDYSNGVINKALSNSNVAKLYYKDKYYYDIDEDIIKEVTNNEV